jgi:hypothetical protein
VIYVGALTTVAVFTPDGGFSAQRGQSPALASLGALTRVDLTRFVPSAAMDGQRTLFAAWAVVTVGLAVVVRLRGRDQAELRVAAYTVHEGKCRKPAGRAVEGSGRAVVNSGPLRRVPPSHDTARTYADVNTSAPVS